MKLSSLAEILDARLNGDGDVNVLAVASLQEAGPADVAFLADARYARLVAKTNAAAVIVSEDFDGSAAATLLVVKDIDEAQEILLQAFAPPPDLPEPGIDKTACVAKTAQIPENVRIGPHAVIGEGAVIGAATIIGPGCVLGRDVQIGKGCRLWPNVVINQRCVLGDRVVIHANSTIGTDGFGYHTVDGEHRKRTHIGTVVIEDDVEIGANSCIDRARVGCTRIGRGTKIDNLVMVAHNVKIGPHCLMAAQSGIAGSSELGHHVVLAGAAGVIDHVKIGDGAMIGAKSVVISDVEPGEKVFGTPAQTVRTFFRQFSLIQKLPEMARELKSLGKRIGKDATTKNDS